MYLGFGNSEKWFLSSTRDAFVTRSLTCPCLSFPKCQKVLVTVFPGQVPLELEAALQQEAAVQVIFNSNPRYAEGFANTSF